MKERIFGYDILKALAAFLVVLYHVGMVDFGYRDGQYYYPTLVQVIWLFTACGVPLFFMVNGALTVHRNYNLRKSTEKVLRLVLVAVLWGVVAIGMQALNGRPVFPLSLGRLSYYWFLFSLALLYVVNYVLSFLPMWCRWVVVGGLLVYPFASNQVWDLITLHDPETHLLSWRTGFFTLYGVVYLYAGDFLRTRQTNKWIVLACGIIGLALLALQATAFSNRLHHDFEGGNYCFPTIGALLLSVAIFLALRDCKMSRCLEMRPFITFLGNNALGIYIFHLLLMMLVGNLVPQIHGTVIHPVIALMIALLYTVLSAGISELIRRSPVAFLLKL